MYVLPILADEQRIPLDHVQNSAGFLLCECPGVVAVVRPLDVLDASKWNDLYPGTDERSMAATHLVFEQLIRLEGLTIDGVEFDKTNPKHKRSMPMGMRTAIYLALRDRATLSEEQEKNSDLPSVSGGTEPGASSPVEVAASA